MSARLIKKSELPGNVNPSRLMPKSAQRQTSVITPFVPGAKGDVPTSPGHARSSLDPGVNHIEDKRSGADVAPDVGRLISEAQARAEQIEREARERGLSDARARADAELSRLAEPLRRQLSQTIEEVANLHASMAERAERDLVKLAIEIAKKIVHRQVTVDSEVALTLARVALARIHNRAQAKIYLHPDDFAYVTKHLDRLSQGTSVELAEDRSISRGSCLIETEMGDIDARIEQQFAELERSFLGV